MNCFVVDFWGVASHFVPTFKQTCEVTFKLNQFIYVKLSDGTYIMFILGSLSVYVPCNKYQKYILIKIHSKFILFLQEWRSNPLIHIVLYFGQEDKFALNYVIMHMRGKCTPLFNEATI